MRADLIDTLLVIADDLSDSVPPPLTSGDRANIAHAVRQAASTLQAYEKALRRIAAEDSRALGISARMIARSTLKGEDDE